jgi:hypothetical protein
MIVSFYKVALHSLGFLVYFCVCVADTKVHISLHDPSIP